LIQNGETGKCDSKRGLPYLQKFYKTFDEAYVDARKSTTFGIIQLSSNCTNVFPLFNDLGVENDLTHHHFFSAKALNSHQKFTESLMDDCEKVKKVGTMA
jgi:hypothetical protein